MLRLGFDEFEVSHPVLLERLEKGETGGIPLYYQPTAKPAESPRGRDRCLEDRGWPSTRSRAS